MAEVNVNFLHPTDGRMLTVAVDETITAQEAIAELIAAQFIPPSDVGYQLATKAGGEILPDKSFRDAGIQDNNTVRIIVSYTPGWLVEKVSTN